MLGSLGALIEIIYRLRRDLSGYFALISERLGVFATVWGLLSPLVISQALASALDDGHGNISAQDIMAPILSMLGLFFVVSVLVSCTHVSKLQKHRKEMMLERAGTAAIFEV